MTESEAKKYMLIEKECINRDCNRDCANCDIVQNVEDLNNAYDIAINVLGKQIPKKPVEMKPTDKLLQEYFACPICGGWVGMDEYLNKFCAGCGQAIDWSDEEYGKNGT